MTVKEFLEKTFILSEWPKPRKKAVCNDGFSISIQGGTPYHYCKPRITCNSYLLVELGYPSSDEDMLIPYAENKENLQDTVYGYVPLYVVEQLIKKHGGIKST